MLRQFYFLDGGEKPRQFEIYHVKPLRPDGERQSIVTCCCMNNWVGFPIIASSI